MTIQDLENLDLYKCSLQDINKAKKALGRYMQKMINNGESTDSEGKASDKYIIVKRLHVLISRARNGMTPNGVRIQYNTNIDRVSNCKSVL